MDMRDDVNFIESEHQKHHPPMYCVNCDVRMMFILTGRLAQKYLCGMCSYTVDPNESSINNNNNNNNNDDDDDDDNESNEFYSKHKDALRSVDDDNDVVGGKSNNNYSSMIVQSNSDNSRQVSKTEERRPRRTGQRIQQQQLGEDDWAYHELKRDIEADGQRHVVEINDFDNNASRVNKIKRPVS
jgi:hypothetical protein